MSGISSRTFIAGLVGFALLAFTCGAVDAKDGKDDKGGKGGNKNRVRLTTRFTGVNAKAKFETKGTKSKFEFEIERSTPGATGSVSVKTSAGTSQVGTFTVNSLGRAEVELESEHGDVVPALVAGDTVSFTLGANSYSGTLK